VAEDRIELTRSELNDRFREVGRLVRPWPRVDVTRWLLVAGIASERAKHEFGEAGWTLRSGIQA
jgi:hypothetical protein